MLPRRTRTIVEARERATLRDDLRVCKKGARSIEGCKRSVSRPQVPAIGGPIEIRSRDCTLIIDACDRCIRRSRGIKDSECAVRGSQKAVHRPAEERSGDCTCRIDTIGLRSREIKGYGTRHIEGDERTVGFSQEAAIRFGSVGVQLEIPPGDRAS